MSRRTVLVTGSSGRLGAPLVRALALEHHVVQLDIRPPEDPEQQAIGPCITGSILDPAVVAGAMDGVDAVVHSAAIPHDTEPGKAVFEANVLGTFNMLEAAGQRDRVEHVVFLSSIRWHGLFDDFLEKTMPRYLPVDEDHPSTALTPYACSKVHGELLCQTYTARWKKPVVALRPSMIVAVGHESGAERVTEPGWPPEFRARPEPKRPHLLEYVGSNDLVSAIRAALAHHPPGGFDAFLINAPDQCSTTPSLELTQRYFPGVPVDQAKLSRCGGFGAFVDCSHAQKCLGWQPGFRCKRH